MRRLIGILAAFGAVAIAACSLDVPTDQQIETQVVADLAIQFPDGAPAPDRPIGFYAYQGTACGDPRFTGNPLATLRTGADGRVLTPVFARGTLNACVVIFVVGGNAYRDTIVGGLIVTFRPPTATPIDTVRGTIKLTTR